MFMISLGLGSVNNAQSGKTRPNHFFKTDFTAFPFTQSLNYVTVKAFNPYPAELNSGHNACAAEYPFTNWASPTEFSLGY